MHSNGSALQDWVKDDWAMMQNICFNLASPAKNETVCSFARNGTSVICVDPREFFFVCVISEFQNQKCVKYLNRNDTILVALLIRFQTPPPPPLPFADVWLARQRCRASSRGVWSPWAPSLIMPAAWPRCWWRETTGVTIATDSTGWVGGATETHHLGSFIAAKVDDCFSLLGW